jgi:hypothetical protein
MATLGTQLISTSYTQLIKTLGTGGLDGSLQVITDGDDTQSALSLSTSAVSSTGSFSVVGASTLTGAVTCSNTLGVTGAATLSSSLGVTGAVTLSSTLNVTGAVTLSSSFTASTGTATIGTAAITTATIGTQNVTISTVSTSTIGTLTVTSHTTTNSTVTGTETVGTLRVGASGPSLTAVTFATAAYAGATVLDIDHATTGSNVSTGTLAASGVVLGDMVIGNINSIGSTTGATPAGLLQDFRIESAGVLRFTIFNSTQTTGTIPAGTIFATALRFTA